MEKKSQAEIWENKLKFANLYRILMIVFLVIGVVGTTFAIFLGMSFKNYKDHLEHPDGISVVIQTRQMPNSEKIDAEYQINNVHDYGGSKIDGSGFGKTLEEFLIFKSNIFTMNGGMLKGIKNSEEKFKESKFFGAIYSSTDPSSVENPDEMAPVGAPFMILQNANVFYLALFEFKEN